MTIYTPIDIINALCTYLEVCIADHKWAGLMLKSSENVESGEIKPPHVYRFLCPPDEIVEGFPSIVPSVTVIPGTIVVEENAARVPVQLHTAIVCPSISESEKAVPVEGEQNAYTIEPREGYTRENAQRELYLQTLRFTQTIASFVQSSPLKISGLTITPPDTSLPDFPYCTARVDLTIEQGEPASRRFSTETRENTFISEWL